MDLNFLQPCSLFLEKRGVAFAKISTDEQILKLNYPKNFPLRLWEGLKLCEIITKQTKEKMRDLIKYVKTYNQPEHFNIKIHVDGRVAERSIRLTNGDNKNTLFATIRNIRIVR